MKARGWVVLTLVAAVSLLAVRSCRPTAPGARVVAGALPRGFLNAMRLAVADELVAGPIARLDTVLVEELSNRAAPAITVADSLVNLTGLVAVVGHANSASSLATSPIYNAAGVVQVAPTATAEVFSQAGAFSFRMVPPDRGQGAFLAETLARRHPEGARLAVIYVNDEYGRGLRSALLESLDLERFSVAAELPHNEGDVQRPDLGGMVQALVGAEPDVLVWLGRVPVLNDLLPPLRDALGDLPVLSGDAAYWADLMRNRIPEWTGVEYLDFVDLEATPALVDFSRRMQERFGARVGGAEALTYDATRVILQALRAGAETGEEVRAYLMSLGRERPAYEGITGPLRFDESGSAQRRYVLRRIE